MIGSRAMLGIIMVSATGGAACSAPNAEGAAVRAARSEQNAALAAGDLERATSFWTDSVTLTAGLGGGLRGREAYRHAFEHDVGIKYERTPTQVVVSATWPLAFEQGTWTGRHASAGSTPLLAGSYAAQWIKAGGRWRIRAEVFVATTCSDVACSWPIAQP